jgi:hypothetical protein
MNIETLLSIEQLQASFQFVIVPVFFVLVCIILLERQETNGQEPKPNGTKKGQFMYTNRQNNSKNTSETLSEFKPNNEKNIVDETAIENSQAK